MEGSKFVERNSSWPISRCALARTCSSFRRRFRRPLRRAGIESVCDQALALLVEPETIEEAYRMETVAGPQCMVTPVADFTPARLVAVGAEGKGEALAEAALAVMAEFKPQHTLVEIAPCGLPLDPDSKASLVENRDQYARAAQLFCDCTFDAFFLNGFTTAR